MIEVWMEKPLNKWLELQNCISISPPKNYKEWQIMLDYHLVLVTLYHGLQLVRIKTIATGDTEYHI